MKENSTANMNLPSPLTCENMIAVASGKGGVGKTWFSSTLCHVLAKSGKRVLLFDGDLGMANIDVQLGLMPEKDLGAVIEGKATLAGSITRFEGGGFDIIAGRSGSGNLGSLPSQHLASLRNDLIALAANYDTVLVDLGAGIERPVRLLAGPAGLTLVVVTDEPTSITNAYAFIKVTHATNPNVRMGIVVNMAANKREGEETYKAILNACSKYLRYDPPLMGIIRRDTKVREAIRAQMPSLQRYPVSDAVQDVEALAQNLMG
jgi:flagellar biosynthesis protein FlhG